METTTPPQNEAGESSSSSSSGLSTADASAAAAGAGSDHGNHDDPPDPSDADADRNQQEDEHESAGAASGSAEEHDDHPHRTSATGGGGGGHASGQQRKRRTSAASGAGGFAGNGGDSSARHRSTSSSTLKELAQLGLGSIGDGEIITGPRRRTAAAGEATASWTPAAGTGPAGNRAAMNKDRKSSHGSTTSHTPGNGSGHATSNGHQHQQAKKSKSPTSAVAKQERTDEEPDHGNEEQDGQAAVATDERQVMESEAGTTKTKDEQQEQDEPASQIEQQQQAEQPEGSGSEIPQAQDQSQQQQIGLVEDAQDQAPVEDEGVTRCICGSEEETLGLMIQCDVCQNWQHCICMGLQTEDDCPDVYYCDQCRPELHIPLLREFGFLPALKPNSHSNNVPARELDRAREAIAHMAAENTKRLRAKQEWEAREIAHHFATYRRVGKAPKTVLDTDPMALVHAGLLPKPGEAIEVPPGTTFIGGGAMPFALPQQTYIDQDGNQQIVALQQHQQQQQSGAANMDRRQRSSSKQQHGQEELGPGGVPKSPKRRSTMNSRDSNYGWEAIPAHLLADGEEMSYEDAEAAATAHAQAYPAPPRSADRRGGKDRKRKRERGGSHDEEDDDGGVSPGLADDDDGMAGGISDGGKRRKMDDGDVEHHLSKSTGAAGRAGSGKSRGGGSGTGSAASKAKHPNQYTYRRQQQAEKAAVAAGNGGNALGLMNGGAGSSHTGSPSPTKRSGGARGGGNGASSAAGTPVPQTPASHWGLPDHLSHLAHLLPPMDQDHLQIQLPSTKGVTSKNQANNPEPPEGAASPLPFQMLELSENCSKIRFPGRRTTMGEMRKRIRAIGEYVTGAQFEAVDRDRRRKRLGLDAVDAASSSLQAPTSDAQNIKTSSGSATPTNSKKATNSNAAAADQDVEMGDATAAQEADKDTADAEDPSAADSTSAEAQFEDKATESDAQAAAAGKATGEIASVQLLDDLMRQIINFQQKYGAVPGTMPVSSAAIHSHANGRNANGTTASIAPSGPASVRAGTPLEA